MGSWVVEDLREVSRRLGEEFSDRECVRDFEEAINTIKTSGIQWHPENSA